MKTKLRKKYQNLRTTIPSEIRDNYAENIFKIITSNFVLTEKNVSIFLPITRFNEVNTWYLINTVSADFYLPVVKNNELKHILFKDKDQLTLSKWGIEEPSYGEEITPKKLDFVIVPLLAYDRNGNRIGYGAGFYDNFLIHCNPNCIFIGVSFFDPETDTINTYSTDIALHYCVTPNNILKF